MANSTTNEEAEKRERYSAHSDPAAATGSGSREEVLEVGAFRVDKRKFEIRLEGRRLELTMTEFRVLTFLMERRGHTLSRRLCSPTF